MIDFDRRPVSSTLTVVVGTIFGAFVIAALVMGLKTNFSYWWGQQGVEQQQNSTGNVIASQQQFLRDYNDYAAFVHQRIPVAKTALVDFDKTHPNLAAEDGLVGMQDAQTRTNLANSLTGTQQLCVTTANDYNTAANGYTTGKWRDPDMPGSLDAAACTK